MGSFNIIQFRKDIGKAKNSLVNIAFNAANAKFNPNKNQLIEDFNNHEITKEIEAGPTASNGTSTLDGKGNLFSFLGFEEGDKPTEIVKNALNLIAQIDKKAIIEEKGNKWVFKFKVSIPTLQSLYDITPMEWDTKSWLKAIEKGVSGFGYYMYWKTELANSRSGTGLQVKQLLRAGSFKPASYITKILNDFKKRLE